MLVLDLDNIEYKFIDKKLMSHGVPVDLSMVLITLKSKVDNRYFVFPNSKIVQDYRFPSRQKEGSLDMAKKYVKKFINKGWLTSMIEEKDLRDLFSAFSQFDVEYFEKKAEGLC